MANYFQTYLGVQADPGSAAYWVSQFLAGASEESVVESFLTSSAYAQMHPGNQDFVEGLYQGILGRQGDDGGVAFWVGELNAGASMQDVADAFLHSTEAYQDALAGYYGALLARAPDASGLSYWQGAFSQQGGYAALLEGILASPEFYRDAQ